MIFPIEVINPRKELIPYVHSYWRVNTSKSLSLHDKIIPAGHIQLIFHRRNPIINTDSNIIDSQSYIKGQYEKSYSIITSGATDSISVVLQPYSAKTILRIPANKFINSKISISDLNDKELMDLSDKVLNARTDFFAINHIEMFLLKRLQEYKKSVYLSALSRIIRKLEINSSTKSEELADIICLSPKQFSRVFLENIGIMPKSMACIIRLQKAIKNLENSSIFSMAQIAEECGYTDQSHMIRSFQKITSYTPKELISSMNGIKPYSSYYLLSEYINNMQQYIPTLQEVTINNTININPENNLKKKHFYGSM